MRTWDVASGTEYARQGFAGGEVAFSANGIHAMIGRKLVDLEAGTVLAELPEGAGAPVSLRTESNVALMANYREALPLRLWDLRSRTILQSFGFAANVLGSLSLDGCWVAGAAGFYQDSDGMWRPSFTGAVAELWPVMK